MKKFQSRDFYLRIFAATIIAVVFLFLITLFLFVRVNLHQKSVRPVKDGQVILSSRDLVQQPVFLNGLWDTFDNKHCQNGQEARTLGSASKQVSFPIGSLTQAQTDASYRVRLQLSQEPDTPIYFAIPTYYSGSLQVYFNGVEQIPQILGQSWLPLYSLQALYPLSHFIPGQEYQELVITGSFSSDSITLRNRNLVIGTMENIFLLTFSDSSCEMLLFGMLLLLLINGFMFMVFRPNHTLISLLTLFDALLIGRMVFSMNYVGTLFKAIVPSIDVSDENKASFALLFLMATGITGCILSQNLFDPERKIPRWVTVPQLLFYAAAAVVFSLNPKLFDRHGATILIVVYICTFVCVFLQYLVCRKRTSRKSYYLFQFIKTLYVGFVIFLDIFFWNTYIDFSLVSYLYAVFFIMHIIVRLYDNNRSYESVEILNRDLENTVEERTLELSLANQILSELTIRDPLTKTYNRLYFENQMERILVNPKDLYLCIFDLDLFKQINDTYGHNAGDDMLCRLSELVQSLVKDDAIFARIGGEEFVLVYENQTEQKVINSITSIQKAVEDNANKNPKYTTASFGVSVWSPGDTEKDLLRKADLALYKAKTNGRNRIVLQWEMG